MPEEQRETVLDKRVHLEPGILELPQVAPFCDAAKLAKRRVRIGDCELYCELEGDGTPIVLLHGGPGATHHCFHPHFSLAARFARVVYYDQRGCGASDYAKGEGYSVEQAADDLDKLREGLRINRWTVLGHSYGGLVAQCYAVRHPERVMGLVLVGSATDAMHLDLERTRQYDFMTKDERQRIGEIYGNNSLPLPQRLFNAHWNGDWKRQNFYRPSKDELARMALYEWKHDAAFRGSIRTDIVDLRGAFAGCPIPVLLMDGQWDLTWNTDKPKKLAACFPGSRLEMFERAGHSPFADEPERFFKALEAFLKGLPDADVSRWKEKLAAWRAAKESSPEYFVRRCGWGRKSSEAIANKYADAWLNELEPPLLFRTGLALYDYRKHDEALRAFRRMSEKAGANTASQSCALIWEGHVLDLLGRRQEAVDAYKRAAVMGAGGWSFDQYGLRIGSVATYAAKRMKEPFVRLENQAND